jgi:hypothetical protein
MHARINFHATGLKAAVGQKRGRNKKEKGKEISFIFRIYFRGKE